MYFNNVSGVNLIQGLSRSWRSLFAQSGELQTAYRAAELTIHQAYLDIMQDMLSVSLETQRVLRRLMFRFDLIDDTVDFFVPGFVPGSGDRYLFAVDAPDKGWSIKDIRFISNSLAAPTEFLERGVDFDFIKASSTELRQLRAREPNLPNTLDYIAFYSDPFQNNLFPTRRSRGTFYNGISRIGPVFNYTGAGVVVGDFIHLTFDANGQEFFLPISEIDGGLIYFDTAYLQVMDSDLERLRNRGFTFTVEDSIGTVKVIENRGVFTGRTVDVTSIPLWYSDVLVDDYGLSQLYGELLGITETSTENYRNLLRGLLQYYVRGQSLQRATNAVHVIAGLPVFDVADESVEEISTTGLDTTILTDQNLYFTDSNYPLTDKVLRAAGSIDGNVPDDTARWAVFPRGIDLRLLGVGGTDKLVISDGTSPGVSFTADIIKVYNNRRLLLSGGTAIPAGEGVYYGYSVGDNATSYDNKIPLETDRYVTIENFTRDTDLSFLALEQLTDAVNVVDYRTDPQWYLDKLIPRVLMEEDTVSRRVAIPTYFATKVGISQSRIGDPMYKVGADEKNSSDIVELPYFDKDLTTLSNAKEFRPGERIFTFSGSGDGDGVLLYHDKPRDVLYVKREFGTFLQGDRIAGRASNALAYVGYRTRVVLKESNSTISRSTFTSTDGLTGTATGRVAYKIGDDILEIYERPSVRQVRVGDTITTGTASATIVALHEEGLAPAHRNIAHYLMDNIWKYGILQVSYDFTSFEFSRGLETLRELLESGSESRLYINIDPFTQFLDTIEVPTEILDFDFFRIFSETLDGFNSLLLVNGPSLANPDPWKIGESGYYVGGTNPAYTGANVQSTYVPDGGYTDLVVGIVITP